MAHASGDARFLYPPDLLSDVKRAWDAAASRAMPIPVDAQIRQLLEVCYHASFEREEGRPIRCKVAILEPERAEAEANGEGAYSVVRFDEWRRFSVGEIVSLAPAIDPNDAMIAVAPAPWGDPPGRSLAIWGLVHAGTRWRKRRHDVAWTTSDFPDALMVQIDAPGSIRVDRGTVGIVSLRGGRRYRPLQNLFIGHGPVARYFEEGGWRALAPSAEPTQRLFAALEYFRAVRQLLLAAQEQRHGGAFVFLPESWASNSDVHCKYRITYDSIWPTLQRLVEMRGARGAESEPPSSGASDRDDARHAEDHARKSLGEQLRFVASLVRVDGAVAITPRLRVLGFGAELRVFGEVDAVYRGDDAEGNGPLQPFDERGTRHRSMLRFCAKHVDAVGFVISQDGGVRVAKRVGHRLVLWQEMSFGGE
jgi:hypothetical protein